MIKYIRRFNLLTISIVFMSMLVACQERDNKEYPKKVNFSADGGEILIEGDSWFPNITIEDSKGNAVPGSTGDNDSIKLSYEWLTAKTKVGNCNLLLKAEPNKSPQKRKLYVYLYFYNQYAEIKVTQNGCSK